MENKYGPILSVEQEAIVGNVNLASNHGAIYKDLYGTNKVLSLLNERGDPPFLFPNLSSIIQTINRRRLTKISV